MGWMLQSCNKIHFIAEEKEKKSVMKSIPHHFISSHVGK